MEWNLITKKLWKQHLHIWNNIPKIKHSFKGQNVAKTPKSSRRSRLGKKIVTCINEFFKNKKRSYKIIQKITHHSKCLYHRKNKSRVSKIFSKHSNKSNVQILSCTISTTLKKYISLKNAYFLIFYISKINFKKSRIKKKYWVKFKKSSVILVLQKDF